MDIPGHIMVMTDHAANSKCERVCMYYKRNCYHHQIIYEKFNLDIVYLPPHGRKIGHYQKANINHIQLAINEFDWEKAFCKFDVTKMVYIFNETIVIILCNFIPDKMVLFDDKDSLWINKKIKKLIYEEKNIFNCFCQSNYNKQLLDKITIIRKIWMTIKEL